MRKKEKKIDFKIIQDEIIVLYVHLCSDDSLVFVLTLLLKCSMRLYHQTLYDIQIPCGIKHNS